MSSLTLISTTHPMSIIDTLRSKNGRYATIESVRILETFKDETAVVKKRSKYIARVGLEYDNMKRVIDARNVGELPACNAGLNGMVWDEFPIFLKAVKTGKIYVRLYPVDADGFRELETSYEVDGIPAQEKYALSFCTAKERNRQDNPHCRNCALENIINVE